MLELKGSLILFIDTMGAFHLGRFMHRHTCCPTRCKRVLLKVGMTSVAFQLNKSYSFLSNNLHIKLRLKENVGYGMLLCDT